MLKKLAYEIEEGEFTDSASITLLKPLFEQVRDKILQWENIGTPKIITQWIKEGVYIKPTRIILPFHQKSIPHNLKARTYWHTKLKPHYISSGAIQRIDLPQKNNRYISRCFFVEKSSGGFRLVIDLRNINEHFPDKKIKFENLSMLRFAHTELKWAGKIDLSDAYHHLALHPDI